MNFDPFFKQYEALVSQIDSVFEKVKKDYESCVTCKEGCSDCCHALFDLTLVEAIYIKTKFDERVSGSTRDSVLERADKADRAIVRIKHQAQKDHQEGKKSEGEILEEMATMRVRCPLLNDQDRCDAYELRPITCRLYGIPTVIGDKAHGCGLSAFEQGRAYPTVKMDTIHKRLYDISFGLAQEIKSKYPKLAELLLPLSMALLTQFDAQYLGVKVDDSNKAELEEKAQENKS